MTFPLFAQNGYEGAGFYRIQNQGEAGRYISIENDKVSEESKHFSLSGGKSVSTSVDPLRTVKSKDSKPGTIIYISGNASSGLTLEAQGLNTDDLLAKFGYSGYQLKMSGRGELNTTYEGYQIDLIDYGYDYNVKNDALCAVATLNYIRTNTINEYALWNFKKIDNVNEFFGVNPNELITDGKKYYTTLFTSFAYQLSEGMKAYYIGRHFYDTNHVEEPIAELIEITGGKIPAATPLKGRVFCFIPKPSDDQSMKNALEFNKKTMCVLGMKDITIGDRGETTAKLVFVNESNNDYNISTSLNNGYIPANKAYLPLNSISSSEADAIAKKGIRLLLPADYDVATSITKVVSEDKTVKEGIYTLTGVKVKDTNSTENLPSGIYIINGKKQVIR